jgi:hypothetical protein
MRYSSEVQGCAAKLELALKTFRITSNAVDEQWTDVAREDFQVKYLTPLEKNTKNMLEAMARVLEVIASAERHCNPD